MKPRTFKLLRNAHRWSGVFFAPLIILFAVSGLLQILDLGGYDLPEPVIAAYEWLEDAHQDQQLRDDTALRPVAAWLSILMGVALILTTLLGLVMAWTMYPKQRKLTTLLIALGIVLPLVAMLV